jgi:hypothetical protein
VSADPRYRSLGAGLAVNASGHNYWDLSIMILIVSRVGGDIRSCVRKMAIAVVECLVDG